MLLYETVTMKHISHMLTNVRINMFKNLHSYLYYAFSGQLIIRVSYMLRIVLAEEGKILLSNQITQLLIFGRWYVTREAEYVLFQAIN
jgi:hypothetical protein